MTRSGAFSGRRSTAVVFAGSPSSFPARLLFTIVVKPASAKVLATPRPMTP